MILTAIYHMLTTGEVFNPSDLGQVDMPEELRQKRLQRDISSAITLLKRQGILAETFAVPPCA